MKQKLLFMIALLCTFAGTTWAENGWDIQASTSGSVTTFTISRTNTAVAETVKYRLVNLSAYAGQHYYVSQVNGDDKTTVADQTEALSGEFTFTAGETSSRTIKVTESAGSNAYAYYKDGTQRSYKLEVTDAGGFYLTSKTRSFTKGTKFSDAKVSKSITNLVYFNSSGNYTSDVNSSKYLDVSYTPPSGQAQTSGNYQGYVLIDDSYDYKEYPATVSTSDLINTTGADATYLYNLGYKIYATVCFTEKEKDDGYQYVQILAGTSSSSYDTGYDPNGSVNTPVNCVYKTCFELSDGSNAEGKQYFPHRYSYANKTAETSANIGITEFSHTNGHLWKQAFKSSSYQASTSGSLIFDANVSNITTRFDAGGDNDDTWGYKDFFVRMALVDASAPTMLAVSVAPGYHAKGNTVYVSVAFNEIVTVTGTPTLTTTSGNNWGSLSYVTGSGTNVLTFSKTIPANASGNLNITGLSGTVEDLAGNSLTGSGVTATGLCSVDESYTYTITYDLDEGTVATENPTTYTWETATFTLNNPTRTGYTFNGWTGSNGSTPNTTVTIANHSHGNKSYTADWNDVWGVTQGCNGSSDHPFTISTTQGLDLLAQCVNSGNTFYQTNFQLGSDITYSHTTDWNDADSDENNFTAIGTPNFPFNGTFDGNNHTVSGIRIYNPDESNQGLFGYIMSRRTVRSVRLADSRITAKNNVGGIVGYNGTSCTVEDCVAAADVCIHAKVADADNHGGITGYNAFSSKVQRCISRATLTVADAANCEYYGGIAGCLLDADDNTSSTIRYCLVVGATIPNVGKHGAIAGKTPLKNTKYNYYRSCTVAGVENATGVGSGDHRSLGSSTDVGTGALPLYAVTLPANASLVRTSATDDPLPGTNNTIYATGADIEGVPYACAKAKLNLSYNIAALTGYTVAVSTAETTGGTAVTVTDNGNYTYDLTMPAADVTVSATPTNVWGVSADIDGSTAEKAYTITTTDGLDLLATLVNNGNDFRDKFFRLGDDITYSHKADNEEGADTENNYTAIGGLINGN